MKSLERQLSHAALSIALSLAVLPALAVQPQDAWITTQVKMALLTDDSVNGLGIDVDSADGLVTLHGRVDSRIDKAEAETLARRTPGVRSVQNFLVVVPASARAEVEVADDALAERITTVLERDAALADSEIEVKSVNAGVVVLSGDAKTASAHLRALEDARAVEGVRQVASEIRSPDALVDAEIRRAESPPDVAEDGFASTASDAWITTRAKLHLMADLGFSPFDVDVDTRGGLVTLFGSVADDGLKARAATEVRKVSGVIGVDNQLQVVPTVVAERIQESDHELREAVRQRLDQRSALADSDIDVAVANGVVRLTGTVPTQSDRLTALTVARSTAGVGSVLDGLELERQG